MKTRNDFVSNSSSSSFIVAIDSVNHDSSKWYKPSDLRVQPDTKKIMMEFDDFSVGDSYKGDVLYNWKFVCTQLIYWIVPEICTDRSNESIKKIMRKIHNNPEFIRLNEAVKSYVPGCEGVEFDEEDLRVHRYEDGDYTVSLVPDCVLDHESVYNGFDDMLKESKCQSIEELIWGVKEIRITYS